MSIWGRDDLDPYEIDESESFMRGKPAGWYAMDQAKRLVGGPYRSWQDCMHAIRRGDLRTEHPGPQARS
jgi:hypothetical protein